MKEKQGSKIGSDYAHSPEIAAQGRVRTGISTKDAARLAVDTTGVQVSIQHYPVSMLGIVYQPVSSQHIPCHPVHG
jgi:hypothetical protein